MWLALAAVLAFSLVTVADWYTDPVFAPDDHRQATRFLAERWRPGDAILVNAGYAYTALLTFWDGDSISWRGRLVGNGDPATGTTDGSGPDVFEAGTVGGDLSLGWGDPRSDFYAMSESDTATALAQLFEDFDRVWVYRIYDTVTDPGGFIRSWLDDHALPFEDQVFSGEAQLRVQGFVGGTASAPGPDIHLDAGLADGTLRLLGAGPWTKKVEVGATLDLAPVWRVEARPQAELILFAGLFDAEGQRWAQTDERPLGSRLPVASWPEGATVRTPFRIGIPAGTPPGTYQLELGWYRFEDGQPFWVPWAGGERLVLGAVEVIAPKNWQSVPPPTLAYPTEVQVGPGIRFLGFDAGSLEAHPGAPLELDLVWQAVEDSPARAPGVLRIIDSGGVVVSEDRSAPVGGRMPFTAFSAGQVVRDPRSVPVPVGLEPGIYELRLGRMDANGEWMPVRRGLAPLGSTYPLASIRVLSR